MNVTKSLKLFIALVFIIVCGMLLFFSRRKAYENYFETKINGPLDYIIANREYTTIRISSQELSIPFIKGPLNNYNEFVSIAMYGDSVTKRINNDTLTLNHKGHKYLYTVKRY